MAEQEMAIPGPQMAGTQYPPNITVFPDRDPNDNRGIRIPRRAFKMVDTPKDTAPDINNPKDGNKVVSPDNLHTDPVQKVVDPEAAVKQTKVEPKETLAPTPVVVPVKTEDKPKDENDASQVPSLR